MAEANKRQIWFGEDLVALHEELLQKGWTSQDLPTFAKAAFHEKVDNARGKYSCDVATIEKICQEQIMKLTKASQ